MFREEGFSGLRASPVVVAAVCAPVVDAIVLHLFSYFWRQRNTERTRVHIAQNLTSAFSCCCYSDLGGLLFNSEEENPVDDEL